MKAVAYTEYGSPDVLEFREVERPVPRENEVLVDVHAAALNAADWGCLRGKPFLVRFMTGGVLKPRNPILGADISGRVESVGRDVTRFQPGDEVLGDLSGCGWGGLAEYVCAREDALTHKPASVAFEDAAAIPIAAVTALQGLRNKGKIRAGQKVLINGASGGMGTFAVQIAKSFGTEVTAVCSTRNVETARSIGADRVIDYSREDFTRSGHRYDLIMAANGHHRLWDYRRALNPGGTFVATGGSMGQIFQSMLLGPWISLTGSRKIGSLAAKSNREDLAFVAMLVEAGEIKPVIDRRFPLSEAADAFRYLGEGHARGKVIIAVKHDRKRRTYSP